RPSKSACAIRCFDCEVRVASISITDVETRSRIPEVEIRASHLGNRNSVSNLEIDPRPRLSTSTLHLDSRPRLSTLDLDLDSRLSTSTLDLRLRLSTTATSTGRHRHRISHLSLPSSLASHRSPLKLH